MAIELQGKFAVINGGVLAGKRIPLRNFPEMWSCQFKRDPFTGWLESFSQTFVAEGMPPAQCFLFLRFVCGWGGLHNRNVRLIGNWVTGSEGMRLRRILIAARDFSERKNYQAAIREITKISGIGISFGSKALRFISPNDAAVLDKKIREGIGYGSETESYESFVSDCSAVGSRLNSDQIFREEAALWRPADVELAFFSLL